MNWDRVKSMIMIGAGTMILFVHAPPILVDPLKTALAQIRNGNTGDTSLEEGSIADLTSKMVKKLLK